jgi:hypothetical protein
MLNTCLVNFKLKYCVPSRGVMEKSFHNLHLQKQISRKNFARLCYKNIILPKTFIFIFIELDQPTILVRAKSILLEPERIIPRSMIQ